MLIPLGLTAAASAAGAGIHKKFIGSGTTTLAISNREIGDVMKTVKFVKDSDLLITENTQTIENKTNKQTNKLADLLICC